MTDKQKIAYEWAKSHDYPSIAARYARELAGLVDDLQEAYDAMAGDLEARTKQVRRLQEENAALRGRQESNDPLTLDELRKMDRDPVWVQFLNHAVGYWDISNWHNSEFFNFFRSGFLLIDEYGKTWLAYRQKPEEGTV